MYLALFFNRIDFFDLLHDEREVVFIESEKYVLAEWQKVTTSFEKQTTAIQDTIESNANRRCCNMVMYGMREKILWIITDSFWYVENEDLQKDLHVRTAYEKIKRSAK